MTNEELIGMIEEHDLLDVVLDYLIENGDSTDDLANNEHAILFAKDLLDELGLAN